MFGVNGGGATPPHGIETVTNYDKGERFFKGNIECHENNPTFVYIAGVLPSYAHEGYYLYKYNIQNNSWEDLSVTSGFNNPGQSVFTVTTGFTIDPLNDNNWWFVTNKINKSINGVNSYGTAPSGYNYHADGRFLKKLSNGKLIMGHDGGVGISDDEFHFTWTSKGLNAAVADGVAVTQKPPYYLASGFWHGGLNVYNPEDSIWHHVPNQDGSKANTLFLNNDVFICGNQKGIFTVKSGFNTMKAGGTKGGVADGSENIYGRVYQVYNDDPNVSKIFYNKNDFQFPPSGPPIFYLLGLPAFNNRSIKPQVIPNDPNRLLVIETDLYKLNSSMESKLHFFSGLTSGPNEDPLSTLILDRTINLDQVYDPTGTNLCNFGGLTFDPTGSGDFWLILHRHPLYGLSGEKRIMKYDYSTDSFEDISFHSEDNPTENWFPTYIDINSIEIDRQTSRVYIGTSFGVYYLDEVSQIWRKHSKNLPYTETFIDVLHCTGEIYAASHGRGIWKTDMLRDPEEATEWVIDTDQTWAGRVNLFNTLVIKTGTKLTLTGEIFVFGNQKIKVEPGAELIVDGGRITTWCDNRWEGIEVMGTYNQPQNTTWQGKLTTKNDAIIENARQAVSTWEKGNWATTGGILDISETTFKNNKISIFFYPYHHVLSNGYEAQNVGKISNCEFLWDDDYLGIRPKGAITLYDINGVKVMGCDFIDSRTSIVGEDERAMGVYSLDAVYRVMARPNSYPQSVHYEFGTSGGYDVNNFVNLKEGVTVMGANSVNNVMIDHCYFKDNIQPIYADNVMNGVITRNKVEFTDQHPSDITECKGISLANSTGYHVEGNTFFSDVTGLAKIGITSWNSGAEDNSIYRNYINDQTLGLSAQGTNSNTSFSTVNQGNLKGLTWECNDVQYGQNDLNSLCLSGIDGQGVKLNQGNPFKSMGNKFTSVTNNPDYQYRHTYDYDLKYYYFSSNNSDPRYEPTIIEPNVVSNPSFNFNQCVAKIGEVIFVGNRPHVNQSDLNGIQSSLITINSTIESLDSQLETDLTNGNSQSLHEYANVLNEDPTYYLSLIEQNTPYLSSSVLIEVGEHVPDFVSYEEYFDLIEDNIESLRDSELKSLIAELEWDNAYEEDLLHSLSTEYTDRGVVEFQLMTLKEEREELNNRLFTHFMTDSVVKSDSIEMIIMERNHSYVLSELVDFHINQGNIAYADTLLDSLETMIDDFTLDFEQIEMSDFVLFKNYILTLLDTNGIIQDVSDSAVIQLTYFAENLTGKAASEAKNILCFHRDICFRPSLDIAISPKAPFYLEEEQAKYQRLPELKVIPNPNNGSFVLEVPSSCEIDKVSINDITGRAVPFEKYSTEGNKSNINIGVNTVGIQIIHVICKDGTVFESRILVNK